MSADSSQKVLSLEDKLRAKETQLKALETLKNESIQVKKELIRAQNSLELMASLRVEKEVLARLIGALAPSGSTAGGLVVLRKAAALNNSLPNQLDLCNTLNTKFQQNMFERDELTKKNRGAEK